MSKENFSAEGNRIKLTQEQEIQKAKDMLTYVSQSTHDKKIIKNYIDIEECRIDNEREEESLSISRKALDISERANEFAERAALSSERATCIATSAIILSIIMAIYEIMKYYSLV